MPVHFPVDKGLFFFKNVPVFEKKYSFLCKKLSHFFGKSSSIHAGQGIVFSKTSLFLKKSTVFPIEKLSQAFASPLPCGQGIGKGAQPDTAESSGRRRKPEPWKARFLRTSPQKWPLKKSGNTFQQMKDVKLYIHFQGFWLTDFSHTWCIAEILSKRFKPLFVECCTVEG